MINAPQVIDTARLRLRRPEPQDAQSIFSTYANDSEVTRYLNWPRHRSLADTQEFLQFSDSEWNRKLAGPYLIELPDSGHLIGSTGIAIESTARAATGYVLSRSSWGRGYATEVLQAMIVLARQLGMQELYAAVHPEHKASSRVLEKCGFVLSTHVAHDGVFPNLGSGRVATLHYMKSF
jgi:ribosomal-protein-alanine N-acetyltransferase